MSTEPNEFKKISIRGRIAFSISCLEAAILKANGNLNDWEIILNQLWKYTVITSYSIHYTKLYEPDTGIEPATRVVPTLLYQLS